MLQGRQKLFLHAQKGIDIVSISICWGLAYLFRFHYLPDHEEGLELLFLKLAPVITILTLYFFHKGHLYTIQKLTIYDYFGIIKANIFALISLVIFIYFFGEGRVSRLMLVFYALCSTPFFVVTRIITRKILKKAKIGIKHARRVLLIGNGTSLLHYVKEVNKFRGLGVQFLGWMDSQGLAQKSEIPAIEISYDDFRKNQKIDTIVVSYQGKEVERMENFLTLYYNDTIPIQILPNLSHALVGYHVEELAGIPIISINRPEFSSVDMFLKRCLDIAGSSLGLTLLSPLFFFIAILVRFSSKGPVFYGQNRVGLDGLVFTMWKFRTMAINEKKDDGPEWSNPNNPRKTKVGSFLRKTSLDELPQLWNVLRGEMTLVGPRPEQPFFVEKFRKEIPGYMLRHKMRAGITGWAQVNGWRGDTSLKERIRCDIYYIRHWTFWLDIKILFLTVLKGFINKNAY